jgi:hypothetical protein
MPPNSGIPQVPDRGSTEPEEQTSAPELRPFRKKPVIVQAIQYFHWMRERDCLPSGVFICYWEQYRSDLPTAEAGRPTCEVSVTGRSTIIFSDCHIL